MQIFFGKHSMKKVLIIARAFPPFLSIGHSIRVVKFIKYLPGMNWMPLVLTVNDQDEYELFRKVGSENLLSEIPPQIKIYRTTAGEPSLTFLKKEEEWSQRNRFLNIVIKIISAGRRFTLRTFLLPDRHLAWLPFALHQVRNIIKSEQIDVILATCPPHSSTIVGACIKFLYHKPLILDFRDDWIDTPWYKSRKKIRQILEKGLESWVVKVADKVILVTEWSRKAFRERYPFEPPEKFILITNGCDLKDFTAVQSMPIPSDDNKFKILHAGSLNDSKAWERSPLALFQAIHQIHQEQPELAGKLEVIFAGDFPPGHRKLADDLNLSEFIKGIGHLPHDEVLKLAISSDLLLAINYDGFSTLIPGKIYEYWAVGGPPILLLSCPGAAANFIDQHKLGITVDPSDVVGIRNAILDVYRQKNTTNPFRITTQGIEAFDRQALTGKLAQVLSMVCPNKL